MRRDLPEIHIAGVGTLPVEKRLSLSLSESIARASARALADARIPKEKIDAFYVAPPGFHGPSAVMWGMSLARYLGLTTRRLAGIDCGGMSALAALATAADAIALGRARVALVAAVDWRFEMPQDDFEHYLKTVVMDQTELYTPFEGPYGLGAPIPYYAMSAQVYMREHGVSLEDLARVAVQLRAHASANPEALHREPLSPSEVAASPVVSPPFRLLDCSPFAGGAAAAVVVGEKPERGVKIRALGEHHTPTHFLPAEPVSLDSFEATVRAGRAAYKEAGVGPADIDVAEIYGVFSATELLIYEDLGFFRKGEAPRAVAAGRTTYGGDVVMNPTGGRLSLGHPPAATPLYSLAEIVRQLRGEAGPRQVPGAQLGLVHAEHGMLNGSLVAILEGP